MIQRTAFTMEPATALELREAPPLRVFDAFAESLGAQRKTFAGEVLKAMEKRQRELWIERIHKQINWELFDRGVEAFTWSARMNANWKVSPTLDVQGMYMYRAPMNVEQGRMSAFSMASLSLRQKLRGDRSSLTLRVMDPFNTMGFTVRTDDGRFIQESDRRFGARAVFLGFNYNFGRPPRIRQPQPQQAQPDADPRGGVRYGG